MQWFHNYLTKHNFHNYLVIITSCVRGHKTKLKYHCQHLVASKLNNFNFRVKVVHRTMTMTQSAGQNPTHTIKWSRWARKSTDSRNGAKKNGIDRSSKISRSHVWHRIMTPGQASKACKTLTDHIIWVGPLPTDCTIA